MLEKKSKLETDLLNGRMTFAIVLRADYSEIQRLKKDLLHEYDCTVAYHELSDEKRYITDTPPEGVDLDGGASC
ncbi:hypothetical protein AKJ64_01860 [candidate division MSBL1 archaeon SCGC-AAA259E17]|uniref:Uncharacterized protein n=1 Tax=candidate division MSBL1 archaeon SCGC-AAA259E17 TaxID=1698263 RepID=A0A133UFL8_9EURY|nr:hypothetical protein AKJ64_01860 [candidate division MSBL1 archaeon SCGC-AAA259E17]